MARKKRWKDESIRLKGWDYSSPANYFITLCTNERKPFFGVIKNGVMNLSEIGLIIKEEWEKSFVIRKELFCDIYVIMPGHIHAIISILEIDSRWNARPPESDSLNSPRWNARPCVPTEEIERPCVLTGVAYRPPKSISSFIAGFKSAATKRINEQFHIGKIWQSRFYDHIIRNSSELRAIRKYILDNPKNWGKG